MEKRKNAWYIDLNDTETNIQSTPYTLIGSKFVKISLWTPELYQKQTIQVQLRSSNRKSFRASWLTPSSSLFQQVCIYIHMYVYMYVYLSHMINGRHICRRSYMLIATTSGASFKLLLHHISRIVICGGSQWFAGRTHATWGLITAARFAPGGHRKTD